MDYTLGNIKLYVEADYDAVSVRCAGIVAEQINNKPESVVGFATGGTPEGTYAQLIKMNKEGKVDFSKLTTFNLDEYYPIKKTNDQSYDYFMKDKLFNHINLNMDHFNIINGEAEDALAECAAYEEKIANAGGIDFQILGIGVNGHIGFNEPEDCFSSATHKVALTQATIDANARFFDSADDVPKAALTMGIKTIMMADKILLMASGASKAKIMKEMLFGPIVPNVPASVLQLHKNVVVVLDKEAAAELAL